MASYTKIKQGFHCEIFYNESLRRRWHTNGTHPCMESNTFTTISTSKRLAKAFFVLCLSSLLTALTACVPSKGSPETPVFKLVSISEKASGCEAQLREKMQNKRLFLQSVSGLESVIASANALMPTTTKTEFSVRLQKQQVQRVNIQHSLPTAKSNASVTYSISQAGKGVLASFYLEIEVKHQQDSGMMSLVQRLNVSENCELTINKTEILKIKKISEGQYTYNEESILANHEKDVFSDKFTTPTDAKLADLVWSVTKPSEMPPLSYIYIKKMGIGSLKTKKAGQVLSKEFGLNLVLDTMKIQLFINEKIISTMFAGHDENLNITLSQSEGANNWTVPLELWKSQRLSESKDLNSFITSDLSAYYLSNHSSIRVVTDKNLSYDHLAAYWALSELPTAGNEKNKAFLLAESQTGYIKAKATSADLESNETIQADLPEIQAIAQNIIAQAGENRIQQIQLLLKYLSENYPYDNSMVATNNVRALTTKEALDRKTGVCQHFSVIFTAAARAMKIPTRIVIGYSLAGASPGLHAWVESEVQAEMWKPIEPQDANSLTQMKVRMYLPLLRGLVFENQKNLDGYLNMRDILQSQTYHLKPAQ